MTPPPHRYHVRLAGGPSGHAQLSAGRMPPLHSAPPADYGGPGDAWSPEHLLLASVQSCFLFTFRAIARLSRLEFEHLDVDAEGTVDRDAGVTRFTEIVLRPRLTVAAGVDHERAVKVLENTERKCLIAASLSVPVRLEVKVQDGDPRQLAGHGASGRSIVEP
jgi:peroxiredoxin-like protein